MLCQVFQKGDQKVCNNCSLNIKITNGTSKKQLYTLYIFTKGKTREAVNITSLSSDFVKVETPND